MKGTTRVARAILLAAATALVLAACGGGGSDTADEPTNGAEPPAGGGGGGEVIVSASEFAFDPDTISVPAGEVTIRLVNEGIVEHDFTIEGTAVKVATGPGQSAEQTVTLDPGTYHAHCSVPGHQEAGMEATVTVE